MKKNVTIMVLGAVFILSGCTHYYYLPATHNVPLFTQKGDLKVLGGAGCGEGTYNIEMQGAYSILDYLSVSAGLMGMGSKENALFDESGGESFDGAVGFYRPLGKAMVFETYFGIGGFSQHHQYNILYSGSDYENISNLNAMRLFLQPDFGYVSKTFEIAFSTRITKLNFTKVDNRLAPGTEEYIRLAQISRDKRYLLVEPALTLRGGGENLKIQVQLVKPFPERFKGEKLFDTFHVSVGFIMTFTKDYWKKMW